MYFHILELLKFTGTSCSLREPSYYGGYANSILTTAPESMYLANIKVYLILILTCQSVF
jgi:hypothetical protein